MDFIQICEQKNMNLKIALDKEGNLWKSNAEWQPIAFNENYQGYYPFCTFTAIAATDVDFVAAGMGEDGLPYVYRSVMGGVWESANLLAGSPLNGFVRASGKVNRIVYDGTSRQIFLLCANGELVTMPDCPKCVRVRKVTDCALVDGQIQTEINGLLPEQSISGQRLVLINERGEKIILNQYEMTQVRASLSYVREQLKKGGFLVDLRKKDGAETDFLGGIRKEQVLHIESEELEEWLSVQPRELFVAFLCEYGTQADEAAHYARRHQFSRAYSLGGAGELFHIV